MVLREDFDIAIMSNLPSFRIVDTYTASKAREQKFRSWLKLRKKLGHKISRSTNKEGGPVQIREIPSLVQLVISRGHAIPEDLRQVLQEVISQRQEAALFYRSRG
jgi:hypothetical protein